MSDTSEVQEKSTTKVWVLIIDTKHGTNVSVHLTRAAADGANHDYCDEWWDREFGPETRPGDDQIVAEYWNRMNDGGEEWHLVTECEMALPQSAPTDRTRSAVHG